MADYPYLASNKNIQPVLEKIRTAAKPPKFTISFMKQLGFTSSNDSSYPALLKKLGFLMEDGTPTIYYDSLRDKNTATIVLGERIRELYSDLFVINTKIYSASDEEIKGAISRVTGKEEKDVSRIAATFKALCNYAEFENIKQGQSGNIGQETEEKCDETKKAVSGVAELGHAVPDFHYNIQIHLPATTDISVYNAIFRSIKENLL